MSAQLPHAPGCCHSASRRMLAHVAARLLPPDDAGDKEEVPNTSSRHALGRPSPTQPDASTGAAQAVRELKAENRRRGTSTQRQQTVSDAAQMEAAAAQDAGLPAAEAEPLQVSFIADYDDWLICIIDAPYVLGPVLLAAAN